LSDLANAFARITRKRPPGGTRDAGAASGASAPPSG
jgi:hypothetical protein